VSRLTTFVFGAGFGAALVYFLDPKSGSGRRAVAQDKATKYAHQGTDTVQSAAQAATSQAQGVASRVQSAATGGESAPDDDVTLKHKVESEIFRDNDAKGRVNVQAVNGVVELRGQLDDRALIEDLEAKARKVTGVREVRNMLHLPGETPVNIVGTPGTGT
jgi:osmotically-inducible protein OsmY